MTQSCCEANPGNKDTCPVEDSHDHQPCKTNCICEGAVLGDGVDLDLISQCVLDAFQPFTAIHNDITSSSNADLHPGDQAVISGRFMRYQLMSLLC